MIAVLQYYSISVLLIFCSCDSFIRMKEEIIPLTDRGTLTLPSHFRKILGLKGKQQLIGQVNAQGEIVLRPAAVFPIEMYSEERITEFSAQDKKLGALLNKKH